MIQRIQTLYLLVVAVLLVVVFCQPVGCFLGADGSMESVKLPWGLACIVLLSAIVSLATIFLFRNRILQTRMTVFTSLLLVGYYVTVGVFIYSLQSQLEAATFHMGYALCLPAVCIILNYLAFRAIYKDEVLVKSLDRLR